MLMDLCCVAFQVFVKQKDKEYQSVCSKGKKTMINIVTYLVETGETPLLLCGVWTLVLMVAGEKDAVDDGKIKKMRAVVEYRWTVVDCWTVESWTDERKRLRD
jgi:hypothetical protein